MLNAQVTCLTKRLANIIIHCSNTHMRRRFRVRGKLSYYAVTRDNFKYKENMKKNVTLMNCT